MDLKELTKKTLDVFNVSSCDDLRGAIIRCVMSNDEEKYSAFANIAEDLSTDWLQGIFQYYHADRKEKKQDYTPKTLAIFMAKLCGEAGVTVDMCAGSGALTIQRWSINKDEKFILYELDENVLPFLLFNMALRNIECIVHNADVLQDKILKTYVISKGERFGSVKEGTS